MDDLFARLDEKLGRRLSGRWLADRFPTLDPAARSSSLCTDPVFLPFFYHLGQLTRPGVVLDLRVGVGLRSGAYGLGAGGCGVLAWHDGAEPARLARCNLRSCGCRAEVFGGPWDEEAFVGRWREAGAVLLHGEDSYDRLLHKLDLVWGEVGPETLIVADEVVARPTTGVAVRDFCRSKNRPFKPYPSRHGTVCILR